MRSHEERFDRLQQRARSLRRRRMKTALLVSGSLASSLFALLAVFAVQLSGPPSVLDGSGFAGSSMLSEGTGAFVLTAVLSFMAGAALTILIRIRKERGRKQPKEEAKHNPKKEAEEERSTRKGGD